MSRKPTTPVFLQRASYRQRRVRDAAKLLPFVGVVLLAIPLAWTGGEGDDQIGASGLLYVFGVWVLLIVLTALLSNLMRADRSLTAQDKPEE
ncbi:hypothetical protein [Roseobacter sp. CCS2]|uniref:hypothetical protein n=1 Tax=Roseobacter sp. CCS2 TaxID=391593 RepID=UPI0000F3F796|nr:hypothetical protein [Roseobacter sp. CCS2]EBA10625.1 hypothetical protein RCCS2_03207 [Roseobacter sp. CCS2]